LTCNACIIAYYCNVHKSGHREREEEKGFLILFLKRRREREAKRLRAKIRVKRLRGFYSVCFKRG